MIVSASENTSGQHLSRGANIGHRLSLRDSVRAMDRVRRRVIVSGRVQNVWYRDSCRSEALARGVGGWVRNCSDGSVEAVFEGSQDSVDQMIAWCRVGPPRALVNEIDVIPEPVQAEDGFVIR
jgi:acylphosphatase